MYIGTIIAFLDNFKSSTKYYIRNRITSTIKLNLFMYFGGTTYINVVKSVLIKSSIYNMKGKQNKKKSRSKTKINLMP